nr:ribonuclease H-like domain-containing protein [Tanacetum cinerariifolium]
MCSVDLKKVASSGGLTCLFTKATLDESNLLRRKLGHINFQTMNKLVRRNLVRGIENLKDLRVKVIRCDNGTEFKNRVMNQLCEMKGIKREFSIARTPQQNRVTERKNRTLIEAARTMLADSKLPTTFWAESVNTACYVQNRVSVIKPHNKTPYELFLGRKPALSFMRLFGCPVTILNIIDHLGKFDGKADEGFFIGYSTNSKAFKVFNSRTSIVEENRHVKFSENAPNIAGSRLNWLFDIDALTKSMNYKPDTQDPPFSSSTKDSPDAGYKQSGEEKKKDTEDLGNEDSEAPILEEPRVNQEKDNVNSTNKVNTVSSMLPAMKLLMIKAISLFLAYASFKDLLVYQMDVKSAFLYEKIKEEIYVCQPLGFKDPDFPDKVYKVEKALYGLHQAPRAWKEMCTEFENMMHKKFQMSSIGELTFFLASTPMETHKTLLKDEKGEDADEHLYRSMIGSFMYLTSSRPDIMFVICACARFQVNPKILHLHVMKESLDT